MKAESTPPELPRLLENRHLLHIGAGLVFILVLIAAVVTLGHLRRDSESRVRMGTQHLAKSVEQTIAGVIDTIDLALLASTDEISRQISSGRPDRQSITGYLTRQQERLPYLNLLRATNEKGDAIYGAGVPFPPANNSDRDYFARLRDDPRAGLVIAKPIIGKISQKWIWLMARRTNRPDGSFGGVAYASIYVDEVEKLLAQIKLQPDSVIALRDSDLGLIARSVFNTSNPVPIGDKVLSTPFKEALQRNPDEGSYISDATTADNVSRIYSYRRNAKHGFTVLVGVPMSLVAAEWHREAIAVAGFLVTFALVALTLLWLNRRAWQQQDQSQKALRESDERMRSFFDNVPVGIFISTREGKFIYTNPAMPKIMGYDSCEELMRVVNNSSIPDVLYADPPQRQSLISELERDTPEWLFYESRYRRKDGSIIEADIAVGERLDLASGENRIYGIVTDITERKENEKGLILARQIVDTASEAIFVSDLQGNLLDVNAEACRLAKYTREEMLRLRNVDIVAPEEIPRIAPELAQCDEGAVVENRWLLRCSDGATVPLDLVVQRLPGDRYLAIGRDLTEGEKTLTQLAEARDAAEAANLTKSRFLAAASHDLRQPMQAISLFHEALARTNLSTEQRRISNYLSQSIQSLGDLLNALLDISKLDAGVVKATPEVIQAEALAHRINAEFSPLAAEKSLRFKLCFPFREMAIVSDGKMLMNLLGNLVGNAIKYTEQGGILIAIRRRGHQALIQVWDSGIGIAPEYRDSIYEEYFQIDNPERDRAKGLGLGLSIARRLARLLDTELACHSRPGKGSIFEFRLPLADHSAKTGRSWSGQPRKVAEAASSLTGCRIVVVEDDVMVARAIQLSLASLGANVIRFRNAEDALADSTTASADFYVADFRLPGLNGIEFLDAIAQRSTRPVKGVLLTGDTSSDRIEMAESSRWAVLFKPVDLPKLIAAIEAQDTAPTLAMKS